MNNDDRTHVRFGTSPRWSGAAPHAPTADPRHRVQHGGPGHTRMSDGDAQPSARHLPMPAALPADLEGEAKADADGGPGVQSNPSAPYGVKSEPTVNDQQTRRDTEPDAQLPPQSDERWQKFAGSDGEGSGRMRASGYGYGGGPFVAEQASADHDDQQGPDTAGTVPDAPSGGDVPSDEEVRAGEHD